MADQLAAALAYAQENRQRFLDELIDFVRIPSISTDAAAKAEMQRAAEWVANELRQLGMEKVQILPTGGHPVVFGEWMHAGAGKPTVLIYGHYDVQPVEPLELWQSPPFEPTLRGENLYGRGASDMKGQVVICMKAVEALARSGQLPVNIKWMVEGEEEIGSPNLEKFIAANPMLLAADFALNADTGMLGAQIPTITYGLRGLVYFEVRVYGPASDLHSGLFGGAVHNPAQALCELIAGMHDASGRITLPGFYESVRELSQEERAELARLPMNDGYYREATGVPALYGEAGYRVSESIRARPTLEVNGFLSGFTGEGQKTVLPSKAMAKLSMRLVPDQTPEQVHEQLLAYMEQNAPPTVRWEVLKLSGGYPSVTDIHMPAVQALRQALEDTWGVAPLYRREGGSVPVTAQMSKHLDLDSVLTGFGLPDDNLHAPNEKMHVPTFYRGIEAVTRFLMQL